MVIFDGKVLGMRSEGIGSGNGETALIIFIYHGFEVSGENVAVLNFHIVNKTVGGKFLNESAKRKNIMHTSAQSMVFHFSGTKFDFSLQFADPSDRATTVDQDITGLQKRVIMEV